MFNFLEIKFQKKKLQNDCVSVCSFMFCQFPKVSRITDFTISLNVIFYCLSDNLNSEFFRL